MGVVVDEADESLGWLEFIDSACLISTPEVTRLLQEGRELLSIMSAAAGTARYNQRKPHPHGELTPRHKPGRRGQ
jgi:hypothetical protein